MLLTAHSGSDDTPENSRLFIETMIKFGVSSIEVDVRERNGVVYLSHDPLESLESCLRLDEAFKLVSESEHLCINCDLKESHLEENVIKRAEEYGLLERLILSGTVQIDHLPKTFDMKHIYYNPENNFPHFYKEFSTKESYLSPFVDYCKEMGIRVINVNVAVATDAFIARMHKEDIQLSIWTVNDFEKIDDLKVKDIANVTTRKACTYRQVKNRGRLTSDRIER